MANEEYYTYGGLFAFVGGLVGIMFSGISIFPFSFWDIFKFLLEGVYGNLWNTIGLVVSVGVIILSVPMMAGKWLRGVTVGILVLGVLEIIFGYTSWYWMTSLGGIIAVIGALFGIYVWRVIGIKPKVVPKKVVEKPPKVAKRPRTSMPVAEIEGIGRVYATRLKKENVGTVSKLSRSSITKVASAAKIKESKAKIWKQMANILLIEEVDEEAAELIVVGGEVTSQKDLAGRKADELYSRMQDAVKTGKVKIPKGYRFTKKDVENWIKHAKIK
ncbi:MAG: DUF4332 domain-containing protein [Candidatus Lokiarchaeia archaeon]